MWHHKVTARLARPAAVRPPLIGAGQFFVIPERPSPRKAHPHHESNEESTESQWLFGAGLGARSPQRSPRGIISNMQLLRQSNMIGLRLDCGAVICFTSHGEWILLLFKACPSPRRLSGRLLDFFGVPVGDLSGNLCWEICRGTPSGSP